MDLEDLAQDAGFVSVDDNSYQESILVQTLWSPTSPSLYYRLIRPAIYGAFILGDNPVRIWSVPNEVLRSGLRLRYGVWSPPVDIDGYRPIFSGTSALVVLELATEKVSIPPHDNRNCEAIYDSQSNVYKKDK